MGLTKKQHEVYTYIKEYTLKNGYAPTQREIKDAFGLKSFGSVQRYLKYLKEGGYLTQDWNSKRGLTLVEGQGLQGSNKRNSSPEPSLSNSASIPLLGDIAAGIPIEAIEECDEHISISQEMIKPGFKHYALRVKGDSMIEDGILDGDTAIIRYGTSAHKGQTIVAIVDGEATLKKYQKDKDQIQLIPANSSMSPILVKRDQDFKIAGQLIGIIRSYI